jgi:hypothetical protein
MPRSLGRCMQTSFARGVAYRLASVVIMIRMTVAPIPVRPLLLLLHFSKRTILSVSLPEVLTIGTIFVVIPIVVVLVVTVVDSVAVLVVTTVFFLTPIVLWPGRCANRWWSSKGCSKNKGTEKISVTTMHVVFLLAQKFHLGILGLQRVCSDRPGSDVRYRTPALSTRVHSRSGQVPAHQYRESD